MNAMTKVVTFLAVLGLPAHASGQDFQVIVNAANPVEELSAGDLSLIYFKKMRAFPGGGAVVPVDLEKTVPARERFSRSIHGRSVAQMEAYWAQKVFSGKDFPPTKVASEAEAIAFVGANPDAIAYVSAGASLPEGVKTIRIGG